MAALEGPDGLCPSRRLWCPLLVRCRRLTGYVLSPGVAAPAVLPVPFSTGLAPRLVLYGRIGAAHALARFLGDFIYFPLMLPSVFLSFRGLASGSVVFLALCGRFLDFPGKGCLCLCGGVHLFLENRARLFLPLDLRGGFVPHSWLWSGGGVVMTLGARWFCRLLVPGRSGPFLLLNGEGTLGDIPFYTTYPRACGGTTLVRSTPAAFKGLSPRLRGNLEEGLIGTVDARSIPAPAGEPTQRDVGARV